MAASYRTSSASGGTSGTGNRTSTLAVLTGDLVVVFVQWSGNAITTPTCTDDQAGGTYDLILTALNNASADMQAIFVRQNLVASNATMTITPVVGSGSNTAGEIVAVAVTGVTRVGANAVRGSGKQENQTSGVPTPTLSQAARSVNLAIQSVGSSTTSGAVPNASWIERQDASQITPTTSLEVATPSGSFTGTSAAYVSVASSVWNAAILELDSTTQWINSVPESFSFSDSVSKSKGGSRISSEIFGFVDSVVRNLSAGRIGSEVFSFVDVVSKVKGIVKSASEIFGFADSVSRTWWGSRLLQEALAPGGFDFASFSSAFSLGGQNLDDVARRTISTRLFSESFSFADSSSRALSAFRVVAESFSFSDVVTYLQPGLHNFVKNLSESFALADSLLRRASSGRALTDSLIFSESLARAGSYLRVVPEVFSANGSFDSFSFSNAFDISAFDLVSRRLFASRTTQESLPLSDSLSRMLGYAKALVEIFIFSDSSSKFLIYSRTLAESFSMSDSAARTLKYLRSLSEAFSFVDSLSGISQGAGHFVRVLSEAFSFSDLLSRTGVFSRAQQDSFSTSDLLSRSIGSFRMLPESLTFLDLLSKKISAGRVLVESFSLVDLVSYISGGFHSFSRALSETFSVTDLLFRQVRYSRTQSEIFSLFGGGVFDSGVFDSGVFDVGGPSLDSLSRNLKAGRSLLEAFLFSDLVSQVRQFSRSLAESLSFSDLASKRLALSRTLLEVFSLSDSISFATNGISHFFKSVSEAFGFLDSLQESGKYSRALANSSSVTDFLAGSRGISRLASESFSFSDSLSRVARLLRFQVEGLSFSDLVAGRSTLSRVLADGLFFLDALSYSKTGIQHFFFLLSESFSFSDLASSFFPNFRDIVKVVVSLLAAKGSIIIKKPGGKADIE